VSAKFAFSNNLPSGLPGYIDCGLGAQLGNQFFTVDDVVGTPASFSTTVPLQGSIPLTASTDMVIVCTNVTAGTVWVSNLVLSAIQVGSITNQ
jgi:hypothetical protein